LVRSKMEVASQSLNSMPFFILSGRPEKGMEFKL